MSFTGLLIDLTTGRSAKRFEAAARDPRGVQLALLDRLLQKNAATEYGKRYGFASVRTVEDFQRQVPVVTYEDIKDDMLRVVNGEGNILTAEAPVMFAQTSGTTGDPKFIPVTPSSRGGPHQDQMRTWLWHAKRAHPDIFDGKVISLVSPAVEGYTPGGLPFGSTSGHIYKNMPGIIRRVYSIPYEVFEIEDYQAKYYTIMRISLEHDVRFVATANPSSILKMCEKADAHSDSLIADIRDGALSTGFDVEPRIRKSLAPLLRPNPARAAELEGCRRRRQGRLLAGDYWPRVSLIGCWKGGTVGHYLEKLNSWFNPDGGTTPVRDWGYLSSEARGSIPLADEGSKGVLTVASNFFEFAEVDSVSAHPDDPQSWNCLTADRVESGKEYYVIISTADGLYRYDINDVVRVVDRYQRTPQIEFVRKGRGMTNLTGEKVAVNQIIETFRRSSEATGIVIDHFKAEADEQKSRYVFRVEFGSRVQLPAQTDFLRALDDNLKALNIEYRAKRDSQRLQDPVLHVMREGWYERGRRAQVAGGKRAFQAKTELLSPDKLKTDVVRPELENVVELG